MNKQEALVALLVKARQWEQPGAEVRDPAATGRVLGVLDRNIARLTDLREAEEFGVRLNGEDVDTALICIGAAVLHLLVDEAEVVNGRELDEWLAAREAFDPRPMAVRNGFVPVPVNGEIGPRRA